MSGNTITDSERRRKYAPALAGTVELLITTAIALILYYPLEKKELGEYTAILGAVLLMHRVLQSILFREEIVPLNQNISKIQSILDLRDSTDLAEIKQIIDLYNKINEREFISLKESILADSTARLHELYHQKRSDQLSTNEYYTWLLPILDSVGRGETIHALSVMSEAEWDDSPAERKFLHGNLQAAERGVLVERIFVCSRKDLQGQKNPAVMLHASEVKPKELVGYFVDRDKLKAQDAKLFAELGDGFINFAHKVALIDSFSGETGQVRGIVTMNKTELRKIEAVFERLKVNAEPLTMSHLPLLEQAAPILLPPPQKEEASKLPHPDTE